MTSAMLERVIATAGATFDKPYPEWALYNLASSPVRASFVSPLDCNILCRFLYGHIRLARDMHDHPIGRPPNN